MKLCVLLCSALVSAPMFAAEPAAEKDADKAVRFTLALEKQPLADEAPEMRRWLLEWVVETPDYTVLVCDILGPIPNEDVPYGSELGVQQLFGNVTYQIRNPGDKDETRFQVAGVESVLKAYQAILAEDPKAHIGYFDGLLVEQRKGRLREHLEPIITDKCSERDERQQVVSLQPDRIGNPGRYILGRSKPQ
jgi:hypothetical protein